MWSHLEFIMLWPSQIENLTSVLFGHVTKNRQNDLDLQQPLNFGAGGAPKILQHGSKISSICDLSTKLWLDWCLQTILRQNKRRLVSSLSWPPFLPRWFHVPRSICYMGQSDEIFLYIHREKPYLIGLKIQYSDFHHYLCVFKRCNGPNYATFLHVLSRALIYVTQWPFRDFDISRNLLFSTLRLFRWIASW